MSLRPSPVAVVWAALLFSSVGPSASVAAQDRAASAQEAAAPAASADASDAAPTDPAAEALAALVAEADAMWRLVETQPARAFLKGVQLLPPPEARVVYRHSERRRDWLSHDAWRALPAGERDAWERLELEPARMYQTFYGTPVAYVRALEHAGRHGHPGGPWTGFVDLRILDIGYGNIGQLRAMAVQGGDTVGVDPDRFLTALYDGDAGGVRTRFRDDAMRSVMGRIELVQGAWPSTPEVREAVGGGFHLITSKNTLKRGYVHPEREAPPEQLIDLGVDDATYVQALFDALEPGGHVVIYNICPAPAAEDEPYIPWADGRCPFDRALLEATGFDVLTFDEVDDEGTRAMARALGWDAQMDVDAGLFAWVTVFRRPAGE